MLLWGKADLTEAASAAFSQASVLAYVSAETFVVLSALRLGVSRRALAEPSERGMERRDLADYQERR